jgi:hypothetical protein
MTDPLAQRLAWLENRADDSDWSAVRRRARRPRRRAALVAAITALATLLVTPAFGIGSRLFDLVDRPPAPPGVQAHFAASNALREHLIQHASAAGRRLHDRFPRVVPGEARGIAAIESTDGPIYLWAAPTEDGRQCWFIQAGAETATGRPYGHGSCDDAGRTDEIVPGGLWTDERPSVRIVHARIYDHTATLVDVEVEGAPDISLSVVAGHALGTVPKAARVEALVARNEDGDVVARTAVP